jgi:hypothetical protein
MGQCCACQQHRSSLPTLPAFNPSSEIKKMQTPISDSSPPRKLDGMVLRDHRFQLPLVYSDPEGEKLEIFAREVCLRESDADKTLPWAIYFQGGPGCASPRPTLNSGWISEVLKTHRLLLLDQRGTGLSSRVLPQTLAKFPSAQKQADYLTHFRADNIVRDAEAIRNTLVGPGSKWQGINPLSPPSDPVQRRLQSPPAKSNFLAVVPSVGAADRLASALPEEDQKK